jgi:hypothetical protein
VSRRPDGKERRRVILPAVEEIRRDQAGCVGLPEVETFLRGTVQLRGGDVDDLKHVLLVSSEGSFFERKETVFEKRGSRVFAVPDLKSAYRVVDSVKPALVVVNATDDSMKLISQRDRLGRLVVSSSTQVMCLVARGEAGRLSSALKGSTNFRILSYPWPGREFLDISSDLLGTGARKYVRVLTQIKIRKENIVTVFGFSRNISTFGMLLESEVGLKPSDSVVLSFMLPGTSKMIETSSVVSRIQEVSGTNNKLYGMAFVDLDGEHREEIEAFLQRKV